jgi:hypothetical protein
MNTAAYAMIGVIGIQRSARSITARTATRGKDRSVRYSFSVRGTGCSQKITARQPESQSKVKGGCFDHLLMGIVAVQWTMRPSSVFKEGRCTIRFMQGSDDSLICQGYALSFINSSNIIRVIKGRGGVSQKCPKIVAENASVLGTDYEFLR